jgi:hypothetical protein
LLGFWIKEDRIIDIGTETYISYLIKHPEIFNLTREEIVTQYQNFGEKLGFEGKARKVIIKELLKNGWIRVRQKRNHWIIELEKLEDKYDVLGSFFRHLYGNYKKGLQEEIFINDLYTNETFNCQVSQNKVSFKKVPYLE